MYLVLIAHRPPLDDACTPGLWVTLSSGFFLHTQMPFFVPLFSSQTMTYAILPSGILFVLISPDSYWHPPSAITIKHSLLLQSNENKVLYHSRRVPVAVIEALSLCVPGDHSQ